MTSHGRLIKSMQRLLATVAGSGREKEAIAHLELVLLALSFMPEAEAKRIQAFKSDKRVHKALLRYAGKTVARLASHVEMTKTE
jgi:hypothetical protein